MWMLHQYTTCIHIGQHTITCAHTWEHNTTNVHQVTTCFDIYNGIITNVHFITTCCNRCTWRNIIVRVMYIIVQHCPTLYNLMQRKITCIIIETIMCNMCTDVTMYVYGENNEHYMLHHVTVCSLTCTWQNNVDQHVHIRWQCVLTCSYVVFLSNNVDQHITIMYRLFQHNDNNLHDMATCTNMCMSTANMF